MTTNDHNAKMLERVRALLAKAESTTFPEEADAFRAKADELMTQYAIDQWMVDAAEAGRFVRAEPERRDFSRSWVGSKFRDDLFSMFVAVAEHCRCVVGYRGSHGREIPVYGLASDLDYLDLLYTTLLVEVAKNLQPPVDPTSTNPDEEVFKQRQAGTGWMDVARKVYEAGLVPLTKGEREKQAADYWTPDEPEGDDWAWSELIEAVKVNYKNRLTNYNRRYVREHGLQHQRNYVNPKVYQRSFMMGFSDEIWRRLRAMAEASRTAYDAGHEAGSMALAVRDIREVALALYEEQYPPPPPVEPDPNRKPSKAPAVREVAVSYAAMSAGRAKAREADLSAHSSRRVGEQRKRLDG